MARRHSSCCSEHHSDIAVVSEVSPQTTCDVTFRLRLPLFKPEGQWNDGSRMTPDAMCNMSCELPPCDLLNVMRIKQELDFVTCRTVKVTLMVANTLWFKSDPDMSAILDRKWQSHFYTCCRSIK